MSICLIRLTQQELIVENKACSSCEEIKPLSEYYKSAVHKDGYRGQCKICFCKKTREYEKNNREKYVEYKRIRRRKMGIKELKVTKTKEDNLKRGREWYKNRSPDQIKRRKEYRKRYCKKNADKFAFYARSRENKVKQATPAWADKRYIKLFYTLAKIEEKRICETVHVDHIIPINGKTVCGLHCEDNLQLLTGMDNMKKHNKLNQHGHC